MSWQRWTFEQGGRTLRLAVNPTSADTIVVRNQLSTVATTGGTILAFEGRPASREQTIAGICYRLADLEELRSWVRSGKRVRITDDFGAARPVLLVGISAQRAPTSRFPGRHEYTITALAAP